MQSGRGDKPVEVGKLPALRLPLGCHCRPAVYDAGVHRRDAAVELFVKIPLKPLFQLRAVFARRQKLDAKLDFRESDDTDIKRFERGGGEPLLHMVVRRSRRLNSERTLVSSRNPLIAQWAGVNPCVVPDSVPRRRTGIP